MAHGLLHLAPSAARWARTLGFSLAAGLGTTIAIAWALSIADTPNRFSDATYRDRRPMAGEGLGRLIVEWSSRPGVVRFDAWVYPTCVSTYSPGECSPEQVVPRWASSAVLPWSTGRRAWPEASTTDGSAPSTESTHFEAAGWPMSALWHDYRKATAAPSACNKVLQSILPRGRPVPTNPVWRGLAVNSVLIGAVWWLLSLVPRVVMSLARLGRGRCAACGYDLAGLPALVAGQVRCPECGERCRAPRERAARRTLAPAL